MRVLPNPSGQLANSVVSWETLNSTPSAPFGARHLTQVTQRVKAILLDPKCLPRVNTFSEFT